MYISQNLLSLIIRAMGTGGIRWGRRKKWRDGGGEGVKGGTKREGRTRGEGSENGEKVGERMYGSGRGGG